MAKNRILISPSELTKLILDCTLLLNRLHAAGLYKTGHAMHEVVRAVGYEIAENCENANDTVETSLTISALLQETGGDKEEAIKIAKKRRDDDSIRTTPRREFWKHIIESLRYIGTI